MKFIQQSRQGIHYLAVDRWLEQGIAHGFIGADLDMKNSPQQWTEVFGDYGKLFLLKQCHSTKIVRLENTFQEEASEAFLQKPPEGDAWIVNKSNLKKICVGIITADCFPVLIVHPDGIAAAHCGWRGTVEGLLGKVIKELIEQGAQPEKIQVAIGPGAQVENYEIGEEVACAFQEAGDGVSRKLSHSVVIKKERKLFGDMRALLYGQARSYGILSSNIATSEVCTISSLDYFSFRRQGHQAGRQLSFISF